MNLYPAIDLYEGKAVRLKRGDFKNITVYSQHPEEMAQKWAEQGSAWIHVVDLEGAKTGEFKNLPSVAKIRESVKVNIQMGGGLRTFEQIEKILSLGVNRVVLGTKALDDAFLTEALDRFQEKIAVGLDVRDGMVQTQGWLKEGQSNLKAAIEKFNQFPLKTIIYTDIQRDGMLQGPNFEGLEKLLSITKASVILSGGISGIADIEKCIPIRQKAGDKLEGVIIGKALYEGKMNLRDAVNLTQGI